MESKLENTTAIVTGGSRGYGAGIAEVLKENGSDVWITGRQLTVRIPLFCARGTEVNILPRPLNKVRPGGLGTHFIREIMDRVEYVQGDHGCMTLVLTRALTSVKQ